MLRSTTVRAAIPFSLCALAQSLQVDSLLIDHSTNPPYDFLGTPWNCVAAKLNFDHVLAGALRDQHGWYGIPLVTQDW
jgi:hypothetical protein